jgi:phasin family protein
MASKSKKAATGETATAAAASNGAEIAAAAPAETAATMFVGYGGLADLGRDNIAAVIAANAALREGIEEIGKEVMGYARTSFESAAEAATALLGAKTFEDVLELNSAYAKASLERLVTRTTKLSEMGVKLANETLAPLGGRVEATIQKLVKPLAA